MTDSTTPDPALGITHISVDGITYNACPTCGSGNITGGFVETGGGIAAQNMTCDICNQEWRNVYNFAGAAFADEIDEDTNDDEIEEDAK